MEGNLSLLNEEIQTKFENFKKFYEIMNDLKRISN